MKYSTVITLFFAILNTINAQLSGTIIKPAIPPVDSIVTYIYTMKQAFYYQSDQSSEADRYYISTKEDSSIQIVFLSDRGSYDLYTYFIRKIGLDGKFTRHLPNGEQISKPLSIKSLNYRGLLDNIYIAYKGVRTQTELYEKLLKIINKYGEDYREHKSLKMMESIKGVHLEFSYDRNKLQNGKMILTIKAKNRNYFGNDVTIIMYSTGETWFFSQGGRYTFFLATPQWGEEMLSVAAIYANSVKLE